MIAKIIFVCQFIGITFAIYGFDCSIWQGTTYTDTVAQCWKNKNAQFVSIGSINRSGKGIETRTNPYLKAMVDRSWNIVKAKRVDVYIFLTKGRDWYKQVADPIDDMKAKGVKYDYLWLDVENKDFWYVGDKARNVAALKQCVKACRDKGVKCGIYTAKFHWQDFFGANNRDFVNLPLWYARWDKKRSFEGWFAGDSFGGWPKPHAHQYTGDVSVCGQQADENYIDPAYLTARIPEPNPAVSCTRGGVKGTCRYKNNCKDTATQAATWGDQGATGCELLLTPIKCCTKADLPPGATTAATAATTTSSAIAATSTAGTSTSSRTAATPAPSVALGCTDCPCRAASPRCDALYAVCEDPPAGSADVSAVCVLKEPETIPPVSDARCLTEDVIGCKCTFDSHCAKGGLACIPLDDGSNNGKCGVRACSAGQHGCECTGAGECVGDALCAGNKCYPGKVTPVNAPATDASGATLLRASLAVVVVLNIVQ